MTAGDDSTRVDTEYKFLRKAMPSEQPLIDLWNNGLGLGGDGATGFDGNGYGSGGGGGNPGGNGANGAIFIWEFR